MNRHTLLGLGGWLAAATLTTVASTWAVSLIGVHITGQDVRPMTLSEVERTLVSATGSPALAQPARPASPWPGAATREFSYGEGSVVTACDADRAVLLSWSPAQGYGVGRVERGPAPAVSVQFASGGDRTTVRVTCLAGAPAATTRSTSSSTSE
ncbi:hypothetical protein [Streptosporangium roseum]|uniref:Septum formation initiator n=1 Tax=Streptosporangium roseum (strain ATCC 12428 / DSM 43021 / JCM 3005 / KCTC 9067 / NCIMB 10171 / NRRL 2505 / NI 9100) TaxID=479432 RepID=D2B6N3_STRRD|nr:hypothetical protein [Streptosporangium roseum]ACZ85797.1 hypothetical protein Sros_2840 [Streptosporangium roseum DSM 43021]